MLKQSFDNILVDDFLIKHKGVILLVKRQMSSADLKMPVQNSFFVVVFIIQNSNIPKGHVVALNSKPIRWAHDAILGLSVKLISAAIRSEPKA